MGKLSLKQKKMLGRILLAAVLLCALRLLLPLFDLSGGWIAAVCFLVPYLVAGWDVLYRAARNIANGQVFDENFLMALATAGAFATGEYAEAVFVMLFYQTGELFQDYAVGRSRQSIAALMDIRPDVAHVEQDGGELEDLDPEDVEAGSVVAVRPGERVPLDGVVIEGRSSLDTAALTGEALPSDVGPGDSVVSGCVNRSGLLRVQATRSGEESTVTRILELVENAGEKKAASEQFITRFARYYTPCVVFAAVALAVLPPLFLGGWGSWFHRALIFLVVSCPCALVISVPLSFFGGIGGASRRGILVKGGNYLEALAKTETVVFDKTGTLTEGALSVTGTKPEAGFSGEDVLRFAALAESYSTHPIALSLRGAYHRTDEAGTVSDVEELAGLGIRANVAGHAVCVGNQRLMEQEGCSTPALPASEKAAVHVCADGHYAGRVFLADRLKPDAKAAIAALRNSGVQRTVMLTGDADAAAQTVAGELGLDEYHAELLPEDKVARIEKLLAQKRPGTCVAFVGDGLNDAPVLARADIGIAMGALGSDAAIEAADVVLMDDRPAKIAEAIRISRRTLRIVRENIWFALCIKGLVLLLGALGYANMWAAVFADVGVAFLAILNAMRCLHTNPAAPVNADPAEGRVVPDGGFPTG